MKKAVISIIIFCFLLFGACRRTIVTTPDVQVVAAQKISFDADDSVWDDAPTHASKLILQDLVEPRLMEPSTQEVRVQAVTDGKEIAFRIEWLDESQNDKAAPRGIRARAADGRNWQNRADFLLARRLAGGR
jgi:hypothetical protein